MLLDLDPELSSLWASVYPPLQRGLGLVLSEHFVEMSQVAFKRVVHFKNVCERVRVLVCVGHSGPFTPIQLEATPLISVLLTWGLLRASN